MLFWNSFQRWWPTVVPPKYHNLASWIAHGVVTVLIMAPYILAGHKWTGFFSALTAYGLREVDDMLGHGASWDNLGDFIGPVAFGLVTLLILS